MIYCSCVHEIYNKIYNVSERRNKRKLFIYFEIVLKYGNKIYHDFFTDFEQLTANR